MKNLIKQIEALMSENETVKANAIKCISTGMGDRERSMLMWSTAKRENQAYQNVLELIAKEVGND